MIKNTYLGIDLGTTNSTASIVNIDRDGKVVPQTIEIQQIDDTGYGITYDQILPSALFIDDDTKYVGKYATKMYDIYPDKVIKEVKKYIGVVKDGSCAKWTVEENEYSPEIVSSYVLKKLKKDTENYLQTEIDSVVITVPASFNFNQVTATKTAAKLAGFDEKKIYTLAEPTAALIDFLNEEKYKSIESRRIDITSSKKRFLVFDLGGGTCDVSIIETKEDDGKIQMNEISISQYTDLGGVDFDNEIVTKLLFPKFKNEKNISLDEFRSIPLSTKQSIMSGLKQIAENAKKTFANKINISLSMDGGDYLNDYMKFDNLEYRQMLAGVPSEYMHTLKITKKEYDKCIEKFLYDSMGNEKNIEKTILKAIQTSKIPITKDDIDAVFLVGGMTNFPTIQKRVYEIFDNRIKPLNSINPMLSVSRGAAVYNYYKDSIIIEKGADTIIDAGNTLLSCNVFVELICDDPVMLLPKNTSAGHSIILEGKFSVSGKSNNNNKIDEMELNLFSAESKDSMNITELESAILKFRRPVEQGEKISIKAEYTLDREVVISAWLTNNENEKIDVVIGKSKLSQEKIEEIQQDKNFK